MVNQLAYVGAGTAGLDAWRIYAGEVLGHQIMPDSDDHALDAWRYGAMSRPNPARQTARQQTYAPGTMGHLRQSVRKIVARLGSESVRHHAA